MARLTVFNQITLDGFFCDAKSDMSFFHSAPKDPEFDAFVADNARGGGILLFGRVTFQLMEAFWPTPAAAQAMGVVAEQMARMQKVVFSRTLSRSTWANSRFVAGNLVDEVKQLKAGNTDLAVMGSGSIVSALAEAGLIDELQLVIYPIVLGAGRSQFEGVKRPLHFTLASTRSFKNGNVFNRYQPAR